MPPSLALTESEAMAHALVLAATPGVPLGPNPRVGCVLLSPAGQVVAEGFHRGQGTPHAEAAALAQAGSAAAGATAVVTLEPCNHTGLTGPCTQALIAAGVQRVVFAAVDPNAVASGGAETLRRAGVEVHSGLLDEQADQLNRAWRHGLSHGRPLVTWKFAASLDGRSAAADGTSKWITNRAARLDTHRLRAEADTILVGTETVAQDDPLLTVRDRNDEPLPHQPLRVVLGVRTLAKTVRIFDPKLSPGPEAIQLQTRDPQLALSELFDRGQRHVFLEGGPTVAAAFLRENLVDEIVCYLAPVLLGAGSPAVADLGIPTITDAIRPKVVDIQVLNSPDEEPNLRLTLKPEAAGQTKGS